MRVTAITTLLLLSATAVVGDVHIDQERRLETDALGDVPKDSSHLFNGHIDPEQEWRLGTAFSSMIGRMSVKALDELIEPFADTLLPALVGYVNEFATEELSATAQGGRCCGWGDFGVKESVWMSGFYINDLSQQQLSIVAYKTPSSLPENTVLLGLRISNVKAGFSSIGALASFALGVLINCVISVSASVLLPLLEIYIGIGMENDGKTILIYPFGKNLPSFSISLPPKYNNTCSVRAAPIILAFGAISNKLTDLAIPMIVGLFNNAMQELMGNIYLD
jgi:hypothetical protein